MTNRSETDEQFLKRARIVPDSPSTWENWHTEGSTLRYHLAETHRQLEVERLDHFETKRKVNMWKLATIIAGALVVMLIFAGWGHRP